MSGKTDPCICVIFKSIFIKFLAAGDPPSLKENFLRKQALQHR